MHTSEKDILRTENLYAFYDKAEILKDINIYVKEGEALAILGPNGAGKTTLIKAICGLVKTKGKILFYDHDISGLKTHERIKKGIAISPEGRKLFPNMNVEDNLLMGSIFNKNFKEKLEFVFGLFPRLKERRKQLAKTMSGGEQQMLAIARALMSDPKLLLLDEPSTGLAPVVVESIGEAILKIKEETRISIVLVEQNINLAFDIADRIYVLANGKIVGEGRVDEFEDIEKLYFYISSSK